MLLSQDEVITVIRGEGFHSSCLIIGVDTHKDQHVAVAIDRLGGRRGEYRLATTTRGYADLERWAKSLGEIGVFGVEGTGSYGAGLARFLSGRGHGVIEVNRPDRSTRRRKGKSDSTDAEMAARAVLAHVAEATPKSGVDQVEMIRMLKITKDSAVKARTQALNQMHAMLVTAPGVLREALGGFTASKLVDRCARLRPGVLTTPTAAAKHALRALARRCQQLTAEIDAVETELGQLTAQTAPALLATVGVGTDTASTLLVTAGGNPERLKSDAAFAALCGVSPIPASSGKTNRHRLNRGGDRRANAALHRVVVVRLRYDQRTREYMQRRTREGMTKMEVIRCLKRYVAREIFALLRDLGQKNLAPAP